MAQIGPKRIRYLGEGRTREASRHSQEEEEELNSSVGGAGKRVCKGFFASF